MLFREAVIFRRGKSVSPGDIISGRILTEPQTTGRSVRFSLKDIDIFTTDLRDWKRGELLTLKAGKVKCRDSGFNRTLCTLYYPEILGVENGKSFWILDYPDRLRAGMISVYERALPEPEAGLLAGMVLGSKSSLDPGVLHTMQAVGISHIVVASGMNVSLAAGLALVLGTLIAGRRAALLFSIPVVWFYVLACGLEAPILRAAIMASFANVGGYLGKAWGGFRLLILSAVILIILSPEMLLDIGFLLSFASMWGLLYLSLISSDSLRRGPLRAVMSVPVFGEAFLQTMFAQLFTLPIILTVFGRYNFISLPVNILVSWTVAPLSILGLSAGILGLLREGLGQLILLPAYFILKYFISVADTFSNSDLLLLNLRGNVLIFFLGYYLLLLALTWRALIRQLPVEGGDLREKSAVITSELPKLN